MYLYLERRISLILHYKQTVSGLRWVKLNMNMGVGSVLKLANTFLFPSLGLRVVKVRPQTCTQTQTTKHKIKEEVEMQGVKGAQVQLTLNFNGP